MGDLKTGKDHSVPDNLPPAEPEPTSAIPAPAGEQPVTAQSAPPAPPAAVPAEPLTAPVAEPVAAPIVAEPVTTPPAGATTVIATAPVPPAAASVAVAEAPAAPVEQESKPRRRRLGAVIFAVVAVLLVAGIAFAAYQWVNRDPTKNAAVGNCLADLPAVAVGEDHPVGKARIVDCADPAAVYLVRGRLDGQTIAQATDPTICQQFEDSRYVYRVVPDEGTGYVLCLHKLDE
jgi:hypothetical protein